METPTHTRVFTYRVRNRQRTHRHIISSISSSTPSTSPSPASPLMMSIYALAHERNENSMRGSGYTHSCELNLDYTKYSQANKQTNKTRFSLRE